MNNTNKELIYKKYASMYKDAFSFVDSIDNKVDNKIRSAIKNSQNFVNNITEIEDDDWKLTKGFKHLNNFLANDILLDTLSDAYRGISSLYKTPLYLVDYIRGVKPKTSFGNHILDSLSGLASTALVAVPILKGGKIAYKLGLKGLSRLPKGVNIRAAQKLKNSRLADKDLVKSFKNKDNINLENISKLEYQSNILKYLKKLSPDEIAKYIDKNHRKLDFYELNKTINLMRKHPEYKTYINKYLKNNNLNKAQYYGNKLLDNKILNTSFLASIPIEVLNSIASDPNSSLYSMKNPIGIASDIASAPYNLLDSTFKGLNDMPIILNNTISKNSLYNQQNKYNISPQVINYLFNKNTKDSYTFNTTNLNNLAKYMSQNTDISPEDMKIYIKRHFDEFNRSGSARPFKFISTAMGRAIPEVKSINDFYYKPISEKQTKEFFSNLTNDLNNGNLNNINLNNHINNNLNIKSPYND